MKLLVATRNPGKFREIAALFRGTGIRLVSLGDVGLEPDPQEDALETATTFAGNALAKARYFSDRTGLPTLAEDSGLVVDALDGEPGVRSKRYAPPEMQAEHGVDRANNLHLLERMRSVPDDRRSAHFHCAAAVVLDDASRVFGGHVNGRILREPRGEGGFGYDPLFLLPDRGVTMAEMSADEKNRISHRGRAIAAAREWLRRIAARETSDPRVQ